VYGRTAEKVGDNCLLYGLALFCPITNWICPTLTRQKIREQKSIEGSFIMDLVCVCCCTHCVVCQMAREVGAMDVAPETMARE